MMVITHNLGFPRIGAKRELKFSLEAYWNGEIKKEVLMANGRALRKTHWQSQSSLDLVPVGDFSFYDHVLDMSFMLGNLPDRISDFQRDELDAYFMVARGQSNIQQEDGPSCRHGIKASEITKWFDTNYHYIVPEFTENTKFKLDASFLIQQVKEAKAQGFRVKPVLIGPLTYLWLGKSMDKISKLDLLKDLLPIYSQLLNELVEHGVEWVQIDEPILVMELDRQWLQGLIQAYEFLKTTKAKILLSTYFGGLGGNTRLACDLAVAGLHIDAVESRAEVQYLLDILPPHKILSLGIINGRNVWKTDLNSVLDWIAPIAKLLKDRLWIAPSCSLIHVPVDLDIEDHISPQIKPWLAFALQKIDEVNILAQALNYGHDSVTDKLHENRLAIESRKNSALVNNQKIKNIMFDIRPDMASRESPYKDRSHKQAMLLNLPKLPTTTIGSFPQTPEIRVSRSRYNSGAISKSNYIDAMRAEIAHNVEVQETLGLDVLVHGEPERNDMVEYFGSQLKGYAITQFGWVQSYGSRCVKPPILFGDTCRIKPMTVEWIIYAQSLTSKPMKAMLTGPVTLLNWSFVRDDQPRQVSCNQLAMAIRSEVLDLEKAGIKIIQIDEAALREGLPLRKSEWANYLEWSIDSFRLAANGVKDETQIHTHMCYSEFNDIIEHVARMDADVITIETSRSNMDLLEVFDRYEYPNAIGPGIYDIHSPNIPSKKEMVALLKRAMDKIHAERLWVNPDCGLKTRTWAQAMPALQNMVSAAKTLRQEL